MNYINIYNLFIYYQPLLRFDNLCSYHIIPLTLTALRIFVVFLVKTTYFLILQEINKKISINCVILMNGRTPPGGVKTL